MCVLGFEYTRHRIQHPILFAQNPLVRGRYPFADRLDLYGEWLRPCPVVSARLDPPKREYEAAPVVDDND